MRRAPGGRGGRKDPNGLTLGGVLGLVSAVWTSLTLDESAQSRITACIPSPPPPPPLSVKQNRGDWGEKGGLAACIKGVIVIIFFSAGGGRWGPGDAQNRDTSATRQKPKYGPKISLKAHVAGMKTFEKRQCDVLEVSAQEHPAYIIKTLLKPPFSSGMNNRSSSAKLRCQVFADLELAYHVTLFE